MQLGGPDGGCMAGGSDGCMGMGGRIGEDCICGGGRGMRCCCGGRVCITIIGCITPASINPAPTVCAGKGGGKCKACSWW